MQFFSVPLLKAHELNLAARLLDCGAHISPQICQLS